MSSPSLQVEAVGSSEQCFSASGMSDMSSGTTIASASSGSESTTASCAKPQSSAISAHSSLTGTPQHIKDWLMSLPPDSPASRSVSPGSEREPTTNEICGRQQGTLFALSSQDSFCLKTCPEYADTCPWSSETCGDLATPFDDPCSLGLTMLGRRTEENGSGFLPTPTVQDAENNGGPSQYERNSIPLNALVKLWPTPRAAKTTDENEETWMKRQAEGKVSTPPLTLAVKMWPTMRAADGATHQLRKKETVMAEIARDNRSRQHRIEDAVLAEESVSPVNASLNPEWVEWLMGWPIGWTSLEPLSKESFEQWRIGNGSTQERAYAKTMRELRSDNGSTSVEEWKAGQHVQGPEILRVEMLRSGEHDGESKPFDNPQKRSANNGSGCLRTMRIDGEHSETPRGEEIEGYPLSDLSHETSCERGDVGTWWHSEPEGVPRVASGVNDRVGRLKALGNGQVPQVAALAWKILRGEL